MSTINPTKNGQGARGGIVTLADVARESGVSLTTASQALSGKERVSLQTRRRVGQVAARLGYEGNPLAKVLAGGFRERRVALLTTSLDMGVRIYHLRLIQDALRAHGYQTSLYPHSDPETQAEMVRSLCQDRPRAIFCDLGWDQALPADTLAALGEYRDAGGILIAFASPVALDCDRVYWRRGESVYRATRHLIGLGHRRLGIRHQSSVNAERQAGFERALAEAGLPLDPEWVRWEGDYETGGARLAEKFLATAPATRPTGLIIVNDVSASAFVALLARNGVRVPDDVSVIGNDDSPAARYGLVPLTTIRTPSRELADETVSLFLTRVRNEYDGPPREIILPSDLVHRESVAVPSEKRSQK